MAESGKKQRRSWSKSDYILIFSGILLPVAYWIIIGFKIQVFRLIPGYDWHAMLFFDTELSAIWLLLLLIPVIIFSLRAILRKQSPGVWSVVSLVCLGTIIQLSAGFIEGRGIDGLRMRMIDTGHAEFAQLTAFRKDIGFVVCNYEEFISQYDSLNYIKSKPPGQMVFYMLTQQASDLISPTLNPRDRYTRFTTVASYAFPLLSYLVLIPLFYLSRMITNDRTAIRACILYLFIPSITLITLHFDQVLYPLLTILTLLTLMQGCRLQSRLYLVLSGVLLYVSLFVSFSLLPLVPLGVLCSAVIIGKSDDSNSWLKRFVLAMAGWAAGFFVLWIANVLLTGYNPVTRFQEAMAFHQQWKNWQPGIEQTFLFAGLNLIEFFCWMGLGLAVVFWGRLSGAVSAIRRKVYSSVALCSIGYTIILIMVSLLSQTKGEVHRLWLFMVPLVCLFAADEIRRKFSNRADWILVGLLFVQFITILAIKRFQDFW